MWVWVRTRIIRVYDPLTIVVLQTVNNEMIYMHNLIGPEYVLDKRNVLFLSSFTNYGKYSVNYSRYFSLLLFFSTEAIDLDTIDATKLFFCFTKRNWEWSRVQIVRFLRPFNPESDLMKWNYDRPPAKEKENIFSFSLRRRAVSNWWSFSTPQLSHLNVFISTLFKWLAFVFDI